MNDYTLWFTKTAGPSRPPHPWQKELGLDQRCRNRLIRVPTGMGKTMGVLLAWLYHRVVRDDDSWPRRLVWCLPMRVLVGQTCAEAERICKSEGVLWDNEHDHAGRVGVHLLMGGCDSDDWHLHPEHSAILIGTQDMLLSRALNRGYAAPRARWPMEFGLLNHDCLWVMDEVQLMDVGLATSAQLQAFREQESANALRPCLSWWMSATLQPGWLQKSPETKNLERQLVSIPDTDRQGPLWDDVRKPVRFEQVKDAKATAKLVVQEHNKADHGREGLTLVVMNTVKCAVQVAEELRTLKAAPDIRLVHSRFRPYERQRWSDFLTREACGPETDRIIVATQVVEAGVDVSARVLVTELAPWSSLVQRFGRSARWGGAANILVADFANKRTSPYDETVLKAAREALALITDAAPLHLERFEEAHKDLLPGLYPYDPKHLLLRHEIDDLFDTSPDLSGADVDISHFIRSGDERDCQVFWAAIPEHDDPPVTLRPTRDALCAVPFLDAQSWLCGDNKRTKLTRGKRAWVWDWLDGRWRRAERRDFWPGQTILVAAACGGYDEDRGWSPDSQRTVTPVPNAPRPDPEPDDALDDEALSAHPWRTIATHGCELGAEVRAIAARLAPSLGDLLDMAGRWHDVGKAHPCFQGSINTTNRPERQDLAKAPESAWRKGRNLYPMPDGSRRGGFRHELASALALFAVLRRHRPDHPALLGPWQALLHQAGRQIDLAASTTDIPSKIEQEILALDASSFDLLAYLVCSHHGKVRVTWHACPADQASGDTKLRIRGIRDGDRLPAIQLVNANGTVDMLPSSLLDLSPSAAGLDCRTGRSWTERCLEIRKALGPFRLAWLEACLRAADVRTSRTTAEDRLLRQGTSS